MWLGFARADAIVGLLIGLVILGILVQSMRTVGRRLMDGVDDGVIAAMRSAAAETPGVVEVESIRARWAGHRMEGDAVIRVTGELSVREAHQVAEEVEHALLHATPSLDGIVVHVHPAADSADDELHQLTGHHVSPEAREAYLARVGVSKP